MEQKSLMIKIIIKCHLDNFIVIVFYKNIFLVIKYYYINDTMLEFAKYKTFNSSYRYLSAAYIHVYLILEY